MITLAKSSPRYPISPSGAKAVLPKKIFAPLPKARWLVPGLMRRGSAVGFIAASGAGKSFLMLDLLCAVSLGQPWLGRSCKQGRVALLDWENGVDELRRRVQGLAHGRRSFPLRNIAFYSSPGDLDSDPFEKWLTALAENHALIIIDPFKAAAPSIDENSADVRRPIDRIRKVARETGCVIVLVHHAGKGSKTVDVREAARGSSAIMDALDGGYVLKKMKDHLKFQCAKARFGREPPPIIVRLEGSAKRFTIRVVESPAEEDPSSLADQVVTYLQEATDPQSANLIATTMKKRQSAIRTCLKELAAEGRVRNDGTQARPRYRVPKLKRPKAIKKHSIRTQ